MSTRSASAYFLLAFFFVSVVLLVDCATGPPTRPATDLSAPHHDGSRRVFVVVVDSLRWQTAMDPRLMPNLADLRAKGVSARVLSTNDAVTHPALRAAFTGRVSPPFLPLLANVARGRPRLDSIFDQADGAGISVASMSDGSLDQFRIGAVLPQHEGGSDYEQDLQDTATRSALRLFVDGAYDFVVAHVTYSDHAAHAHGISAPEYREVFERVDTLIGEIDAAVPADDTLVVFGDHGHDEEGNHGPGLDVPTTLIYRGPAFKKNLDLGSMSITDHRYFMSFALGLPLASSYQGGRHPDGLAIEVLPSAYREVHAAAPTSKGWLLVSLGAVALFALVWLLLTRQDRRETLGGGRIRWLLALLMACGGLGAWGYLLARLREAVHEPTSVFLERSCVGLAAIGFLASLVVAPELVMWLIGGATLILAYPTVYRYGAFASVTALWGMLLLFSLVPDLRRWIRAERSQDHERSDARVRLFIRLALGGAAYLLVAPFLHSESRQFAFESWSGRFTPSSVGGWFILGAIGKLIVFSPIPPWQRTSIARGGVGLCFAVFFTLNDTGILRLERGLGLAVVIATIGLWLGARRFERNLERVLWLAMVYAIARLTMRIPLVQWAWADAFYAATTLSALSLRRSADPRVACWGRRCLLLLGVVASGWITIAWTVHGFEWTFLHDWMSRAFVEAQLVFFLPLLLTRYLLPVLVFHRLLEDVLGRRDVDWWLLRASGLKLLATTAVAIGIAWFSVASDVYIEATQENTLWLVLIAGLFLASMSRRDTALVAEPSGPAR